VFSIQKNGTQFLTATIAASGATATFSSSQTDFAAGDVLKIVTPATADATLADIAILWRRPCSEDRQWARDRVSTSKASAHVDDPCSGRYSTNAPVCQCSLNACDV
jgi:hypothetical protein